MWKFIVDVVHDLVSSLQPDVGQGFLHVSNVFLLYSAVKFSKTYGEFPVELNKSSLSQ